MSHWAVPSLPPLQWHATVKAPLRPHLQGSTCTPPEASTCVMMGITLFYTLPLQAEGVLLWPFMEPQKQ